MVFQKYDQDPVSDEQKLAYDLRVVNAGIIAKHWVQVVQNRDKFAEWFKALRFLYTVLHHDVLESRLKDYEKDFADLSQEFLILANKYPTVYNLKKRDEKVEWEMEEILLKLERRLMTEITKSNMRGSYFQDDGGL